MDAVANKRILMMNSHEAWVAQIDGLALDVDIVVGLSGRVKSGWDTRMRPVPGGARLVTLPEALATPEAYGSAVAHSLRDLLDLASLEIPKLFVIHTTLEGRLLEEGAALTPGEISSQTRKYLDLIRAHVMAVSELKRASWGLPADVVGFSIRVDDYPVATQHEPRGIRVSNLFNRRRTILLADLHDAAFAGVPVEFVGVNPDMPGVTPAADWDDLKSRLSQSRFFIHTADPVLEDGYNMATAEAMAAGLPVLGNRHPTSVVEHGISGFLSDDPAELGAYAQELLEDRELSLRMGRAAREQARQVFAPEKFAEGFQRALGRARVRFGSQAGHEVRAWKSRSRRRKGS
jgi:hypothetical protein